MILKKNYGLRLLLPNVSANITPTLPAGYAIRDIFVFNKTANAVTGGIRIGNTDGGNQLLTSIAVGASAFVRTTAKDFTLSMQSASADTVLYLQAVTSWNSAVVDIVLQLDRAIP